MIYNFIIYYILDSALQKWYHRTIKMEYYVRKEKNMNIRPYEKKDFRYVQDICIATSKYAEEDSPINRAVLCSMYCDYYLDFQPDYCYVAVDDNDVPIGYLLCVVDLDQYQECMQELYLPLVRKVSSGDYFRFVAETKVCERYVRQGYTAHILVNVLPEYRRQGLGAQLVEMLETKLKEMFVEGLYIVVGQKDNAARAFCEKLGYEDIDYLVGMVVYGKKLYTED